MKELSFKEMSKSALAQGYYFKPISVYDSSDKSRVLNNISKSCSNKIINDFMLYNIIDRLTFVRDYYLKKSINFMMCVKDNSNKSVAFVEMLYSKNSEILYIKNIYSNKDKHKKEILSLALLGSKEHLEDYGMKFNTILTSSEVNSKDISTFTDIGMKFMSFQPLSSNIISPNSSTKNVTDSNEIIVLPYIEQFKKLDNLNIINKPKSENKELKSGKESKLDESKSEVKPINKMRIILVDKFDKNKKNITEKQFRTFLNDILGEEKNLSFLFNLFKKNSNVKITLREVDEIKKLLSLFNIDEDDTPTKSKDIDNEILKIMENINNLIK